MYVSPAFKRALEAELRRLMRARVREADLRVKGVRIDLNKWWGAGHGTFNVIPRNLRGSWAFKSASSSNPKLYWASGPLAQAAVQAATQALHDDPQTYTLVVQP